MSQATASSDAVTACVLLIGDELLSGRTQDANLAFIARQLNEAGIHVREARVVPDDEDTIVTTLNEVRRRFDYVFTTGGIGPTHDDITADSIARAFGTELVMDPDIEARIRRVGAERGFSEEVLEASLRMARVPRGSRLIETEVGAPGFAIENVYVMAGIPRVMQSMMQQLRPTLRGGRPKRSRSLGVYLGESMVANGLREIQARYPHIDLGSYPFQEQGRYGTTLVVRGEDEDAIEAMLEEVRELVVGLGADPVERG